MTLAFQDYYPERFSHCFGCGRNNPHGHQLKSYWNGEDTIARFTIPAMYSGGVPDNAYGGTVASLIDCHGTASAAAFASRAQGHELGGEQEPVRFVTASLTIDYLRPTPLGEEVTVTGKLISAEGRKVRVALTLSARDAVCAKGEMLAVQFGG